MAKKDEQTELEKCKAILGTRYSNVLILVEEEGECHAEFNSQFAAYGMAVAFVNKLDNSQENPFD
jgi:hypothetical protein